MGTSADKPKADSQTSGLNPIRGLCSALLLGAIGFWTPIVLGFSFVVCRWWIHDFNHFDRAYDMRWFPTYIAYPAVATASMFAAAGWAAHAPNGTHRFTRTLVIVFAISLASWFVLAALVQLLEIMPRRHKGAPYPPLLGLIPVLYFATPPALTALILSTVRSSASSAGRAAAE